MIKNPEDEKLVTKGAVNYAIRGIEPRNKTRSIYRDYYVLEALRAIDKLPACLPAVRQAVSIKSPEEIGRAIKRLALGQPPKELKHLPWYWRTSLANLLRWVLGQEQSKAFAWTNKGLLGEEQIFGKAE